MDPRRREEEKKKTWQDTLRDDLQAMYVDWEEAKSVAGDCREWRSLVAQCSSLSLSLYRVGNLFNWMKRQVQL